LEVIQNNSQKCKEWTTQRLKPMWSPLFNLGLASFVGVIAAVVALASTNNLRDGSTLVAIPIGIVVWFVGDILRWRGRYPMRLFLMVPIFVALVCTVSIRILQKANQRRIAWNSVIDAGASVKFDTVGTNGWLQYEEGIFVPAFLADWLGKAVFADSAEVAIPMVSFAFGSPDVRRFEAINVEKMPRFVLEVGDASRNNTQIDLDVFSKLVNSNQVEALTVNLYSPDEETIKALQAIRRPYYLYLSGVLTEKAMRHFPADTPVRYIRLNLKDPSDETSWLNFLPSSPNCVVSFLGTISAANLRTIDTDRPLCKLDFSQPMPLRDDAIRRLAKLAKAEFISMRWMGRFLSQDSIEALCKSPVSLELGPISLTPESVQMLLDNEARARLHLWLSSIDSASFLRLAEVKCLKGIYLDFDLTDQDIQSIALFPAEVEITLSPNINQKQQIEDAIKNRK
jgi:hypothetical protein